MRLFFTISMFLTLVGAAFAETHMPNTIHRPEASTESTDWANYRTKAKTVILTENNKSLFEIYSKLPLTGIPSVSHKEEVLTPTIFHFQNLPPAEEARLNIRLNLHFLKQDLVKKFMQLFLESPPKLFSPQTGAVLVTDNAFLEKTANHLADIYITAVDTFLKEHPGAKPQLDRRRFLLDQLGIQNATNAPWCADWAVGMSTALGDAIYQDKEMRNLLRVSLAQSIDPMDHYQHNFVVLIPRGYDPLPEGKSTKKVLILDPWVNLLPIAYPPADGAHAIHRIGDIQ